MPTAKLAVETNESPGTERREGKGYVHVEGLILATTHMRSEYSSYEPKTFGSGLYIEG